MGGETVQPLATIVIVPFLKEWGSKRSFINSKVLESFKIFVNDFVENLQKYLILMVTWK